MKRRSIREVLEILVKELVDNPEEVEVREMAGDQSITLEVSVKYEDVGKVIGKEGKTANALRDILFRLGARDSKRVIMTINQ